jgi:hypothetical protein
VNENLRFGGGEDRGRGCFLGEQVCLVPPHALAGVLGHASSDRVHLVAGLPEGRDRLSSDKARPTGDQDTTHGTKSA